MQEILLKVRCFQRGLSKTLKKSTLFFLSKPVPFSEQSNQKQKGPGASAVALQVTKEVQKNLFVSYISYASQFVTSQIIPLPVVLLYLGSVESKGKNCKSLNIMRTKRTFFDKIKNTFHSFGRAITLWKNKTLIKNSGHKL